MVLSRKSVLSQIVMWKHYKYVVGFTSGVFDLFHAGHLNYLEEAKSMCDRLVIGINCDETVTKLKGPARPVITQEQRARVIDSILHVDAVFIFAESNNKVNISLLQPDIYINGCDYDVSQLSSVPLLEAYGGKVQLAERKPIITTSIIIDTILKKEHTKRTR